MDLVFRQSWVHRVGYVATFEECNSSHFRNVIWDGLGKYAMQCKRPGTASVEWTKGLQVAKRREQRKNDFWMQ